MIILLGAQLNRGTSSYLITGYEDHTCRILIIKKLIYFIHMNHNPMNSNPKFATSCSYELAKTPRIVIKLILSPKMRPPLALRNIGVIFSVHGDSICVTPLQGTWSVGFKQKIVVDMMLFTCNVNSAEARKNGDFCFFWYSSSWKSELS